MSYFFGQDIRITVYIAINDNDLDYLEKNIQRITDATSIKKEDWIIYAIYGGNIDIINFFYEVLGYLPEKDDDDEFILCHIGLRIGKDKDSLKYENLFRYLLTKYDVIPNELYENISEYDPIVFKIIESYFNTDLSIR